MGMFFVDGEFNLPPYCKRMDCRTCQRPFQAVRQNQFRCGPCRGRYPTGEIAEPARALEGPIMRREQ